ncbi:MAG: YlxR family protein [Nocardioidaceae bacterium]
MSRTSPIRTCVGCRERTAKSDLVRVVVDLEGTARRALPDDAGTMSGRGAHLHPRPACLDLAERRRAFPRAFRFEGPLDLSALRAWLDVRRSSSTEGE